MNIIGRIIGEFLSIFYFPYLFQKFVRFSNIIFGNIIKKAFQNCGKNSYIESPIYIVGGKYINIGNNFSCFRRMRIEAHDVHNGVRFNPLISIGNNVSINYDCHIGCINEIVIGDNVLIASRVFITDHFHGNTDRDSLETPPSKRILNSRGKVIIGRNVWIGEGVSIMPNVVIGNNSIIGANAVVTKSFPDNSIIGGIPARLIR